MHPSLEMLDKALTLAEQELDLLETEECPGLQESAFERAELLRKAWDAKAECPADSFMDKLNELRDLQVRLTQKAKQRLQDTEEVLRKSKQGVRAIQGYGIRPRRTLKAMMIAKTS